MTKHLFIVATGKPACGLSVVKGEAITQALFRDLCPDCLEWQRYRCWYYKHFKKWPAT